MSNWLYASRHGALGAIAGAMLAACGGGGDDGSTGGTSFLSWSGSNNGEVVLAANNVQVRFTSDSYLYYGDARYTNVVVVNGQVLLNGSPLAKIVLAPASGGGQIAVMQCLNSSQLVTISGSVLSCSDGTSGGSSSDGSSGNGSGSTSGNGTGGGSGNSGGATGGGSGGATRTPPAPIACGTGNGGGTQGLMFYSPLGYTRYQLASTGAGAPSLNSLSWGVQYQNTQGLTSGSYSGSLRARLWAVTSPYLGGSISGVVLGTFSPNFTGAGARSANQVYVGAYSTTQVQSSGSVQNPGFGSYCIVATLEQYEGGNYYIVDWMQFSTSVAFY